MDTFPGTKLITSKFAIDKIFIVVPAYNEAVSIRRVIEGILCVYPHVVVVDDGSSDGTGEMVADTGAILLRHIINRGQGAALQTGIRYALQHGAEIIITFDADGQHQVQDIDRLLEPLLTGEWDVALGSRFLGKARGISTSRKLLLKAGIIFTRLVLGIRVTDVHNGLRAFTRRSANFLQIQIDRMGHASEILDKIKAAQLKFIEVPVTIYYFPYSRMKGQSSWNALSIAIEFLITKAIQKVTR